MIDVAMPQMGESIAEGTVTRWLKAVGDRVERDEPLLEISTDKVDAEIPAPASGVLREILVKEGETVPIQTVLARIDAEAAATAPPPPAQEEAPGSAAAETAATAPVPPEAAAFLAEAPPPPAHEEPPEEPAASGAALDELRRTRSSPLVRRIAAEHHLDISAIKGTGLGGRVTKQDVMDHLAKAAAAPTPPPPASFELRPPLRRAEPPASILSVPAQRTPLAPAPAAPARVPETPAVPRQGPLPTPAAPPAGRAASGDHVVPMSPIRKRTAEHMLASKRAAAHATTLFEIDMTRVDHLRAAHKRAYQERGVPLTYLPFILKAAIDALKAHPLLNASVLGDRIVYHRDINLGVAVALEHGLIVPVIRNADEKNVLGLARAVVDLAERARTKRLKVEEVQGATFTITNPGVFGSLFGTPIIPQPQVAILAVGVIEKRPVVREDAIAIRNMAYFALSFDHRIIDGADADRFMAQVRSGLVEFDESAL
jgi:2-oxoglutarate dehydrogenase E2 component (dihydrolipoamide succinyltransferase)